MAEGTPPARVLTPGGRAPAGPTFPAGQGRDKGRAGRPSRLTREVEEKFLSAIRGGNFRHDAAAYAGLSRMTVEGWIRRGRGQLKDRLPTPEYVRFARMVDEAEATAKVLVTSNLVARSRVDHNAALAWLRTRYPNEWPRFPDPDSVAPDMLGPGGMTHIDTQQNLIVFPISELPAMARQLLEREMTEAPTAEPEPVIIEMSAHVRPGPDLANLRTDSDDDE